MFVTSGSEARALICQSCCSTVSLSFPQATSPGEQTKAQVKYSGFYLVGWFGLFWFNLGVCLFGLVCFVLLCLLNCFLEVTIPPRWWEEPWNKAGEKTNCKILWGQEEAQQCKEVSGAHTVPLPETETSAPLFLQAEDFYQHRILDITRKKCIFFF